jgi:cytochrome c oxidase accessory protein FixG
MASTPAGVPGADSSSEAVVHVVSLYQSQRKVYARAATGRFQTLRWACVLATQLVFYGLPWLTWHGRPAVLFDLDARRFYIFALVLHPQDFIYLAVLLIICAYSLFLFTAVAGRLWCGFACPQTVYTEIFMWIERRFEGDRAQRMKLDASAWTAQKWLRKAGKQACWVALGLWTGITFVGYFTPVRNLLAEAATFSLGAWEWFWVLFYGFATYGNAGWMREQVCKYICPYARFQSAMFDHDTMIVSYDARRGEPRGSRPRSMPHAALATAGKGECIDCALCVHVCPTDIDIRKGLQYECIGCAACVDVCDSVMDKMHYPRGLIRFATQNGLQQGWAGEQMLRRVLRPRVLLYSSVLLVLVAAWAVSIALRSPLRVDVVRDRGVMARLVEDGRIENVYRLQLMNATESPQRLRIATEGLKDARLASRGEVELAPAEARWVALSVQIPPETVAAVGPGVQPLQFVVTSLNTGNPVTVREKSTFVVPR